MKYLILPLLALPSLLFAQQVPPPLFVVAKADGYDSSKIGKLLRVKTSLVNNKDYPITFCNMTCSYDQAFTIKSRSSELVGEICDHDFPSPYTIKPFDTVNYILYVNSEPSDTFEIGFYRITPQGEGNCFTPFRNLAWLKSRTEVIWSNPVAIQ